MRIDANSQYYSPDHGQLCQVIEAQMFWGETTCRVWLPGCGLMSWLSRHTNTLAQKTGSA
jgi:hypothetical protein